MIIIICSLHRKHHIIFHENSSKLMISSKSINDWKFNVLMAVWADLTGASNESVIGVGGNSAGGQIAAVVCH